MKSLLLLLSVFSTVVVSARRGRCDSVYEVFDADLHKCVCKNGFSGFGCQMCESDQACKSIRAPHTTTCEKSLIYQPTTQLKTYKCTLDPSLQSLFEDGAIAISCNRQQANCSMAIYKSKQTVFSHHVIDCAFTGCAFHNHSANVHCDRIECKCSSSCSAVTKAIVEKSLSGKPVSVVVSHQHHLNVDIKGSPIPLAADCNATSCEFNDGSNSQASGSQDQDDDSTLSTAVVVALVTCSVLAGGLILAVCLYVICTICRKKKDRELTMATIDLEQDEQGEDAPGRVLEVKHLFSETMNSQSILTKMEERSVKKTILRDISTKVERGSVLGILGPSGSGKTSLLNALAGVQNGASQLRGHILVDGVNRNSNFRRISAYVHQDDSLFPMLTVRECIEYSAFLRLSSEIPTQMKYAMVDRVISELNLTHVADSRIGLSGKVRGISGGERRRVSIGMELVTSPHILFLDEPTSGLDSSSAFSLICLLKELAQHGRIVVLSVHQPSAKAFLKLDRVILLAKGHVLYNGTTDESAHYFKENGFKCPKNENIADHLLDVADNQANIPILNNIYLAVDNDEGVEVVVNDDPPSTSSSSTECGVIYRQISKLNHRRSCRLNEIQILFLRTAKNLLRNRSLFLLHIGLSVVLGLSGGFIFQHVTNDLAGFQNRSGAFYFMLTFFGFASFSSMDLFIAERPIFIKETGAKYYGPFSYFITKVFLDTITLRIIPATIFGCIFYWIMGLQPSFHHFILYLFTLVLFNMASGAISICLSAVCPNVGTANLTATVVFLIMLVFGGFLLNKESMSPSIGWIKYLSIFSYAFEVLMTNELKGLLISFDAPGYPKVPVYGDVFLKTLGMYYDNQVNDLIALLVMFVGINILAYLFLLLRVPTAVDVSDIQRSKKGYETLG